MPSRAPAACTAPACRHTRPCPVHPSRRWADGAPGRAMPIGWTHTRRRVLTRDGYRCRRCGAPATDVHHIEQGIEYDWNLIALCATCHQPCTAAQAAAGRAAARP